MDQTTQIGVTRPAQIPDQLTLQALVSLKASSFISPKVPVSLRFNLPSSSAWVPCPNALFLHVESTSIVSDHIDEAPIGGLYDGIGISLC